MNTSVKRMALVWGLIGVVFGTAAWAVVGIYPSFVYPFLVWACFMSAAFGSCAQIVQTNEALRREAERRKGEA